MTVTIFTTDSNSIELGKFRVAHVTMFDKHQTVLHFIDKEEQSKFMKLCVDKYVLFQVQGTEVTLLPESNNYQRIAFRFDNDYVPSRAV